MKVLTLSEEDRQLYGGPAHLEFDWERLNDLDYDTLIDLEARMDGVTLGMVASAIAGGSVLSLRAMAWLGFWLADPAGVPEWGRFKPKPGLIGVREVARRRGGKRVAADPPASSSDKSSEETSSAASGKD